MHYSNKVRLPRIIWDAAGTFTLTYRSSITFVVLISVAWCSSISHFKPIKYRHNKLAKYRNGNRKSTILKFVRVKRDGPSRNEVVFSNQREFCAYCNCSRQCILPEAAVLPVSGVYNEVKPQYGGKYCSFAFTLAHKLMLTTTSGYSKRRSLMLI